MKKILIILLLPLNLFCQTILLSDILYGKTHKVYETQDLLLKKGLSYIGKAPSNKYPQVSIYSFSSDGIQYQLFVGDANNVIITVEVYMSSSKKYSDLKFQAKQMGFTLNKNEGSDPLESEYFKDENYISFSSGSNETLGIYYKVSHFTISN